MVLCLCVPTVAPLAGAWIETDHFGSQAPHGVQSRPSRARGLKLGRVSKLPVSSVVAPLAGAWIETTVLIRHWQLEQSRAPRGRVD